MRKKTALRTPQQRETSVREPGGLIDRGENAQDSATAKSALTNRSHRTRIRQLSLLPRETQLGKYTSADRCLSLPYCDRAGGIGSGRSRLSRPPRCGTPAMTPGSTNRSAGLRTPRPPRFRTWV